MSKQKWIDDLKEAHITLAMLRGSIRGNSPSQVVMDEKLAEAIKILEAQIQIEKTLLP